MTKGLDPTLGAVLPLLGVLLGVLAGGGITYLLRRREERADVRAAARVLHGELDGTLSQLDWTLSNREWDLLDTVDMDADVWHEHQLLMGRHLTYDDWRAVSWAFHNLSVASHLIRVIEPDADRVAYGRALHEEAQKAVVALRPVAEN